MVVEYVQDDGSSLFYGFMMPAGPLTAATGRLLHGYHFKCFHVVRKREARGNAVTGRVLQEVPTGYEIAGLASTSVITDRVEQLQAVARRIGKGVGDPTVLEAFWAEENGGAYPHTHHIPLEMYQLRAHLLYAHGVEPDGLRKLHDLHNTLHVAAAHAEARCADPGHVEPITSDWRDQHVASVEELT